MFCGNSAGRSSVPAGMRYHHGMKKIETQQDLEEMIDRVGFLPLFANAVKGLSVEENCDPEYWFTDREGPWEWKGKIALSGRAAYGKFFRRAAGFVSLRWWPDFVNWRRDGYDFDSRCDEGITPYPDRALYGMIEKRKAVTTPDLKALCGYGGKDGFRGFETVMTRLQMQTYVVIRAFPYAVDRNGREYGWGITQYTLPELHLGRRITRAGYRRDPKESVERMAAFLKEAWPQASEADIRKLLR